MNADTWLPKMDLPRLLLVLVGVMLVVTSLYAGATSTTAFGVYTDTWEGASTLEQLGGRTDTPTSLVRNVSAYPTNGTGTLAIILSPGTAYTPSERERLGTFVRTGGTLLVAEDFRPHSNQLLDGLDVQSRFDGRLVRDERHYYQGPALPVATNLSTHPLTNQSDTLTLNHGTVVEPAGNATVVARTSPYAYLDTNGNGALDDEETLDSAPVVVIERVGSGRVILVSDPSIFINAMLERDGNRAFATALLDSADHALIDVSHSAAGIPPLRLLLLVLRDSTALAFLLGVLAIGLVFLWDRDLLPNPRWPTDRETPEPPLAGATDRLADSIAARHPDWDRDRVERVVQALMSENEPDQGND